MGAAAREAPRLPPRSAGDKTDAAMRVSHQRSDSDPPSSARAIRAAIAVVVAVLVAGAGCSAHRTTSAAAPELLRVGTSGDYPPFSLRGPDGAWSGFDVAVARAYALARGQRLELVPFRWPELGTRLAAGDFDVAMSGVTVRADRLLVGTLTAAVARADAIVLVRTTDAPRDLDRPAVRIAVNRGGHLERVARTRLSRATLVPVDDNRSLPTLLASRAVDAVVTDTLEAATFDASTVRIAARLARDRKAYWVGPGRADLAADLDAWLLERERDGTLDRLRAEHLRTADAASLPFPLARVVDTVARRLMVMPEVAAAKRAAGLALVDATREAAVIARAVERARAAGLDATAAEHLARAQIDAAKAVQAASPIATTPRAPDAPTLDGLRTRIDALDAAIVRALVVARDATRAEPATSSSARVHRGALAVALRADADLVGFDEAHAGAIAAAIAETVGLPAR
jgi:cyclohexadienyl dehydratase